MRIIKKAAVAAAGGLAAVSVGMATPAQAVGLIDRPRIDTPGLDLGGNFFAGQPVTGAFLTWAGNAVVNPQLAGNLQARPGYCGRVVMVYYTTSHVQLARARSTVRCGPSTSIVQINSFAHPQARHVHIIVERRLPNGVFQPAGAAAESR